MNQLRLAQPGTGQVGIAQIGTAQVNTAQVGTHQVSTNQAGRVQVGTGQVRPNGTLRILQSPLIPLLYTLPEYFEIFFICHGLKLLLSKYGTLILVGVNCAESFGI